MPDVAKLDAVLLEVIACPTCHGRLQPAVDHSSLTCAACQVRYPVQDGVPVLLVDEAQPLADQQTDADASGHRDTVTPAVGEPDDDDRT